MHANGAGESSSEGSEKQQAGSARDDGDAGRADEALEARDAVVRDADRLRLARLVQLLVGLPLAQVLGAGGLGAGALAVVARAVEQDQVHVIQPEVRQVLEELLLGLRAARRLGHLRARLGLGRDEEGVARQALERGADALLVHVVLGRVDVGEAWARTRSARSREAGRHGRRRAAKKQGRGAARGLGGSPAFIALPMASAATVSLYCHVPSEILPRGERQRRRSGAARSGRKDSCRKTHSGIWTPLFSVVHGLAAVHTFAGAEAVPVTRAVAARRESMVDLTAEGEHTLCRGLGSPVPRKSSDAKS